MLEILYRIYRVPTDAEKESKRSYMDEFCGWSSTSQMENEELLMDVCVCDTRDQFKEIMRSQYGKDLKYHHREDGKGIRRCRLRCRLWPSNGFQPPRSLRISVQRCFGCCQGRVNTVTVCHHRHP